MKHRHPHLGASVALSRIAATAVATFILIAAATAAGGILGLVGVDFYSWLRIRASKQVLQKSRNREELRELNRGHLGKIEVEVEVEVEELTMGEELSRRGERGREKEEKDKCWCGEEGMMRASSVE